jgi:3-phenylpropionate/trans-cinnamate dioxygenase ferredoxin subunit
VVASKGFFVRGGRGMAGFVEVPGGYEIKSGQMKLFTVAGRQVLLARFGDDFYAADNRCPHMGGKLSEGKLENTIVTCPVHHSQFDLTDGHVVRWTDWSGLKLRLARVIKSPKPIKTYKVKVEGAKVLIETDKLPAATA